MYPAARVASTVSKALTRIASTRLGGTVQPIADAVSCVLQPCFGLTDVLAVMERLERDGLPVWLAGGWGLDALFGSQTRFHRDLDIVAEDDATAERALDLLITLGFSVDKPHLGVLWWRPTTYDAIAPPSRRVQILTLDWTLLTAAAALVSDEGTAPADRSPGEKNVYGLGRLCNTDVPCLTASAQDLFHKGYEPRPDDCEDLLLLNDLGDDRRTPVPPAGVTSLIVPVFSLQAATMAAWQRLHGPRSTPHVTILHPFKAASEIDDATLGALDEVFSTVSSFAFDLTEVRWFGDRVVYLAPSRPDLFRAMTDAVTRAFGVLPYAGVFDSNIPHLTLCEGQPKRVLAREARLAQRRPPSHCEAREAWLIASDAAPGGHPMILRRLPFSRPRGS